MKENRSSERVTPSTSLEVYDCNTEKYMGSLIDISSEGFMLMSNEPIKTNTIYQCRINLEEPVDGINIIQLGADSLWCKESAPRSHYWTGFHLIEISEEARAIINKIVLLTDATVD